MRIIGILLASLMTLFATVQFNDPDGLFWSMVYGVPAILALIAALKPGWYESTILYSLLIICLLLAIAGTIYFWPKIDSWWTKDIWWDVETVREGMGMMIAFIVLLLVYIVQHALRSEHLKQT